MIYILEVDYDNQDTYVQAVVRNMEDLMDVKLTLCDSVADKLKVIKLELDNPPDILPDYFESGPLIIVSDAFKKMAETHNVKAEFFPVELETKSGKSLHGVNYFFMHILEEVDCVDKYQSIYEMDDDFYDSFSKLVLDSSKVKGKCLFRLAYTYDPITCVTEGLAKELSRFSGFRLLKPSDWD